MIRNLDSLFACVTALLAGFPQDEAPSSEPPPKGKWAQMEYGPFLSSSVARTRTKDDKDILAYKAVTIKVGPDASICFDTDLARMAGGWTGGFLDTTSTHLISYKGSKPTALKGTLRFSVVGPRPPAHYQGLYLQGDKVILSYLLGDTQVLDMPGFESGVFTRTFSVSSSKSPVALAISDTQWITVPEREAPKRFTVAVGGRETPTDIDLARLCKGGPRRWGEPIVTRGKLGTVNGPYVVDTLTVPENNPMNAWLRFTGMDFFADGRAALCTWNGDVWTVSGIDANLEKLAWQRFAAGLYEPLGLRIVEDKVYVLGRDQITRLHDLNGDGEADFYENFNNAGNATANYHDFAYDLHTDRGGNFYYAKTGHRADSTIPLHGCLLKVPKDGKGIEIVATGLRAPNGLSVGPNDEITCSDNQGNWMPTSRLNWVKKGGFYGYVPHAGGGREPKNYDPPLCWLPHSIDNSSGGQIWVTGDKWGPFGGQLLHTSYGTASLFQVITDLSGDPVQGGVIRFPLTFDSGIMRGRFHPIDGQLYVSGLKGWQTRGARDACLQRVRYTGKPVNMVRGMRIAKGGIEIAFTDPLDPASAGSADNYSAEWWNYAWTEKYGSPDFSVADPVKKGRDKVQIESAKVSADCKSVMLSIPSIRPVMQMLLKMRIDAADGTPIVFDFYATVNRVP